MITPFCSAARFPATPAPPISPALSADLDRIRTEFAIDPPDDLLSRGVLARAALFGCVNFEIFGQYGPDSFRAADELFDVQLQILADAIGLPAD